MTTDRSTSRMKTALERIQRPMLLTSIVVLIAALVVIFAVLITTGDVVEATIKGGRVAMVGIAIGIAGALAGAITAPPRDAPTR